MANEKISDLTTITRLRTGTLLEVEDLTDGSRNITADVLLCGVNWDTPSQVLGYTVANTLEVETNTLAARLSLNPDETNLPQAGWTVSRQAWSSSQFYTAGTPPALGFLNPSAVAAFTDASPAIILEFAWVNVSGICVPKRILGSLATGALGASATAGTCNMRLFRAFGQGVALGTTIPVSFPPSMGGNSVGVGTTDVAKGSTGLKANQPPSQARIQIVGLSTTAQAFTDQSPIGLIEGGRIAASSGTTQFQNQPLYDYRVADQPLILVPGTGFQVTVTMPAGATSQAFHAFLNMTWDEWTPVSPGDK